MIAEEPEPAAGEVGGEEGAINISDDESLALHVQQSGPFGDLGTGREGEGGAGWCRVPRAADHQCKRLLPLSVLQLLGLSVLAPHLR